MNLQWYFLTHFLACRNMFFFAKRSTRIRYQLQVLSRIQNFQFAYNFRLAKCRRQHISRYGHLLSSDSCLMRTLLIRLCSALVMFFFLFLLQICCSPFIIPFKKWRETNKMNFITILKYFFNFDLLYNIFTQP